jgi:hypothetical protein
MLFDIVSRCIEAHDEPGGAREAQNRAFWGPVPRKVRSGAESGAPSHATAGAILFDACFISKTISAPLKKGPSMAFCSRSATLRLLIVP